MTEYVASTTYLVQWLCAAMISGLVIILPACGQASANAVDAAASAVTKDLTYSSIAIAPHKVQPKDAGRERIQLLPDGISLTNISLSRLIQNAYDLRSVCLIQGLPGWAKAERLDFELRMDPIDAERYRELPDNEQVFETQYMLQQYLVERLGLRVHHATQDLVIYELTLVSTAKLKEVGPTNSYVVEKNSRVSTTHGIIRHTSQPGGRGMLISDLAAQVSNQTDSVIVDKTALGGLYDISIEWVSGLRNEEADGAPCATDPGNTIREALREEMGLNMTPTKGPMDTIVIESLQMPVFGGPETPRLVD